MIDYHVVFEGTNGFQKEEVMQFPQDMPSPTVHRREYETANSFEALSRVPFMYIPPTEHILKVKDRCFRQVTRFYALGKHIVYYREERT